jgi:CheY-like chemotaxis protein
LSFYSDLNSTFADKKSGGLRAAARLCVVARSAEEPDSKERKVRAMIKILLVEDSKFLRLATERALARAGYEVSSAADGDEALLLAREKLPDLILLDMLLPKMSGPDVLIALKKDVLTKAIPVVVMTGMSQKNAARLQGDGALEFLEKGALELDKGSGKLLSAIEEIVKKLPGRAQTTTA